MCGIFGYIGNKNATPILIKGLNDLEYRGYDSAGIYVAGSGEIKAAGKVENLERKIEEKNKSKNKHKGGNLRGSVGIAHTRWATHGKPTELNAHPHAGNLKRIWLVHNGVIENYKELKAGLAKKGNKFKSETDTEIVAHLIESFLPRCSTREAIRKAVKLLRGSYALAIADADHPEFIYVIRSGSPLVVGIGDQELFISSDTLPISSYTKKVIFLADNELGALSKDAYDFYDAKDRKIQKNVSDIDARSTVQEKGAYKHFMLKEIMEEPEVINRALKGRVSKGEVHIKGLELIKDKLKNVKRIIIVGCGTAYYSGIIGKYFFEEYLRIPTEVEVASEFRYRQPAVSSDTLVIALSQSGETADTLEAIRESKKFGASTVGIINNVDSTMSREVDTCIYNNAGSEIGVASTKAFVSQVTLLIALGCSMADMRQGINRDFSKRIIKEMLGLPKKIEWIFDRKNKIEALAKNFLTYKNFMFLGRKYQYAIALEGALKLKEISYIHAEGCGSGEVKHGPLAMIDERFPSMMIALKDSLYEKNISTIQEIKARKGRVIAVATEGDMNISSHADDVMYIPKCHEVVAPILSVIPLQLFAYYIADKKGLDVDKPRNLAKSVTVE